MSQTRRPRKLAKAAKVVAGVLAALTVAAALMVGGGLSLARTAWGAEKLRQFALPRVNAAIAGQVDVRSFRFFGDRIVLDGLVLRDPEGDVVARAKRVDVAFSPLGLFQGRLNLREVNVDEPTFALRLSKSGETNLDRALASRNPSADADGARASHAAGASHGADGGEAMSIELGALAIRGAIVELLDERPETAAALQHVRIVGVQVQAAGRYGGDGGDGSAGGTPFGVHLELRGEAVEPLRTPVSLTIASKGTHGKRKINGAGTVDATIGDSGARIEGEVQALSPGTPDLPPASGADTKSGITARVNIERFRVAPALIRLLAPASPIKVPVTMSGRATWDGPTSKAVANLRLAAAGTTVDVNASIDVARQSVDGLKVRARGIDLGRLIAEGPPSDVSFDLEAHGAGKTLETLRGAATLHIPPGRLGGHAIGPIRLRADADRGRYKVMDLVAVVPGARISGAGEATADTIAFRAAVDVKDLGHTVSSVTAGSTAGSPRASGRGRIDLALTGNPRAPSLQVKGHLVALGWQDIRVPRLDVTADVADIRKPLASSLNLNVPEADFGVRRFRGLSVVLRAAGPRIEAHLALAAPETLRLDVAGAWGPGGSEIVFHQLDLTSRQATWRSAKSMRLVFGDDVLRVVGLDLRAEGAQQVRVDFEKRTRSVRADIAVSALDLGKLPASLLPPKLRVAGQITAEIHVKGRRDRPDMETRVALANGRIGNLRDIALDADARIDGSRAEGRL
ncbi:MAG: hypothetical protein H7X95_12810, partial [Deltaproteobacteria bacterium]|nr:hypothetical protein [Deltaproteobacteria bacterium]